MKIRDLDGFQKDKISPRIDKVLRISLIRKVNPSKVNLYDINEKLCNAESIKEIIAICNPKLDKLNSVNISTALHRTVKIYESIKETRWNNPALLHKTKIHAYEVFNMLRKTVLNQILDGYYKPSELTIIAWAFASMEIKDFALFDLIAKQIIKKIDDYKGQDLALAAYAFALASIKNDALFEKIAEAALKIIETFLAHDLIITAWAFAVMQVDSKELFEMISNEAIKKADQFDDHHLTMLLWSYAAIDRLEMVNKPEIINLTNNLQQFKPASLNQLHEVILYIVAVRPKLKLLFSQRVLDLAQEHSRHRSDQKPTPSIIHAQMSGALQQIGFKHINEHFVHGFFLDCADPEKRINFEMDGDEYHYTSNGQLFGNSVLRDRILGAIGWRIIRVKQSEWESIKSTEERMSFLKELLEKGAAS